MSAKIYKFPIQNTRIWQWYQKALEVHHTTNIAGVRIWCVKNVPLQFRQMILDSVRELQ